MSVYSGNSTTTNKRKREWYTQDECDTKFATKSGLVADKLNSTGPDTFTGALTIDGSLAVTNLTTSNGVLKNSGVGALSSSLITNANVDPSAGIVDTKLATISTAGKVSDSALPTTQAGKTFTGTTAVATFTASNTATLSGITTIRNKQFRIESEIAGDVRASSTPVMLIQNNSTAATNPSTNRWILNLDAQETGSNAGSNLMLTARTDTGAALVTPLIITRSTGDWAIGGNVTLPSGKSLTLAATSNQLNFGTTNVTTLTAPAPSGNVTITLPNTATTLVGTSTTDTMTALKTFNAGIKLTTSGGTASTLDYYEEGTHSTTFTFDGSGGTSASIAISVRRVGKLVTLTFPDNIRATTGTSSATLIANTVLPSNWRPIADISCMASMAQTTNYNGMGIFIVLSTGAMWLVHPSGTWGNGQADSGTFTRLSVSYSVA